jgi:thioredoxin-like negative regulator of GroEL
VTNGALARTGLCTMILLSFLQPAYSQAGQNLPDILPYNSLHLFDTPEPDQLTDQDGNTFRNEVLAKAGISVVEFMLPTCLACNPTTTELTDLLSKYKGQVRHLRLNINNNLKLSFKYDIPKVPAVLVFNNGHLVKKFAIYNCDQKNQLARAIDSQLALPKPTIAGKPQPSHY